MDVEIRPAVSLIVPVLADTDAFRRLLGQLSPDVRLQVVVVDGGNDEKVSETISGRPDVRLIRTSPGRAHQMNAGARVAIGEWLFFCHADSELAPDWLPALEAAAGRAAVGGWFRFALDAPGWQARVIEKGVALRVRLLRLPYGDQGIFVRRNVFEALGGFREMPLMEDVEFVRRLLAAGPVVEVPRPLTTSARRWRRDGWFRRSARNLALVSLYFAGVSPARLARWYSRPGQV